ncbi:MAG TPA: SDR family NAD(P)-dependent oxidoreductase [Candidatus Binataceae bacterium]|nr:SDR family NAD(P)-dependent oxidoreductase [Candidatus Binataceae bacterium]
MGKLQDKVALVTGSSSGIGRGVALAFAREGAKVIINYPDESEAQNAEAVRAEIERLGAQTLAMRADVSLEHEAQTLVETVQRNFGRIDILVNNAGIGNVARVEAMAPSQWDRMLAVNLRSVFLCTHFVLPIMYRQDYGRIISTASQLAYKGGAGLAHYCAAKAGIIAFTRSLSHEIGTSNITANCVAPGATQTRMVEGIDKDLMDSILASIPKRRLGTIDEIVPAYVFLASDEARHFVGQCLSPNGGDVML